MTIGIEHVNDYPWFDSRLDSNGNFRFAGPYDYGSKTQPMKVEHEMRMYRTEVNMIRWYVGLNLMKEREVKNSENCQDWNQLVWWSKRVNWDGLDKLSIKVIPTGSNVWHWKLKELERGDTRRLGGFLSIENGMESLGLSQKDAQFRNKWRRRIKGATS